MHPLHVEQTARVITEDRLRAAALARRVDAARPTRPSLRDRVGAGLVRVGETLQHRPAAAHAPRPC